jgi:Putative prokaryotic signal transducing protein
MALVELRKFFTSVEASLAQSYLGSQGVETYLFDLENAWDTAGRIAIPVRMMVDEADESRAARLLADVDSGRLSRGEGEAD